MTASLSRNHDRAEKVLVGRSVSINPSSPKGGCNNPPNGFRPGAQNRTAKG